MRPREGDWFAVPADDGTWIVGLVARRTGHVVLGYFFAPPRAEVPSLDDVRNLTAADSYTQLLFSDLEICNGKWPLIGHDDGFTRGAWPMVEFERVLEDGRGMPRVFAILYDEDDLNVEVSATEIDLAERDRRPRDVLSGAGAARVHLQHRLPR